MCQKKMKKNNNENLLYEKSKEQIINLRREIVKIKNNYEKEKKDSLFQTSQSKKQNKELQKRK